LITARSHVEYKATGLKCIVAAVQLISHCQRLQKTLPSLLKTNGKRFTWTKNYILSLDFPLSEKRKTIFTKVENFSFHPL